MEDRTLRTWTLQHLLWFGPICTFAIAKLTAQQSDGLSIANIALVLAIFTTAIGTMNPTAGVFTSITAGAFLNYFHTNPVNSFRMSSTSDILMISLFTVLGLGVSVITSIRMRHNLLTNNRNAMKSEQKSMSATSATPLHATEFWKSFIERMDPNLSFFHIHCATRPKEEIPTIARNRSTSTNAPTVLIPECGAIIEFQDPRISQVLILQPATGFAPLEVSRSAIFALSSDVELALQGTMEE